MLNEISRCCALSSSFGWGAGAGYVDSVVAVSKFVLVLGLKSVNASSAVELASQNFIGLTETIELSSEVGILSLQAVCMLLECLSLSGKVSSVGLILSGGDAKTLNFTSDAEKRIFLLLKAELGVSELN